MKNRILVLSLDYDDCLIRKSKLTNAELDEINAQDFDRIVNDNISPKNMNKWKIPLKNDNAQLIDYIASIAPQYHQIILCCGSNRQNPYTDITNACRSNFYSGSCYEALEEFEATLNQYINIPIVLDRTVTADFFHHRQSGETFRQTINWIKNDKIEINDLFKECPNDRTKVSLHYMFMHKFASENMGSDIDYVAVDDSFQNVLKKPNPAIIDGINDVYSKNTQIIPINTTFTTIPYQDGKLMLEHTNKFVSTGNSIDSNYNRTMQQIMIYSMDGKNQNENKELLFDYNACSGWDVFSSPEKQKMFYEYFNANVNSVKLPTTNTFKTNVFQSQYSQFSLETRQFLSEVTQMERHQLGHMCTEDFFNQLTKTRQDQLLDNYKENGNLQNKPNQQKKDDNCSIQ